LSHALSRIVQPTGVPETFFVDRGGRAIGHSVAAVSQRELDENLKALLKEGQ
jgi:hypothetical protein